MDLFTPIVDPDRFHKNFASVLDDARGLERALVSRWAEGFVDRDGKFVEEFQTTFNSSFWEIYLYAIFEQLGITVDWSYATPDFHLTGSGVEFIVEATTANAAQGKPNEWDRTFSQEELEQLRRFKSLNTEAIIRLSNAIVGKARKYAASYSELDHVKGKPFVIAIAPFEQPHFNHQHDRPIRALLYDHYVDEDAYLDNPEKYPQGPPSVNLGFVQKDNGSEIQLGIFNDASHSEISAIIFSCLATWGKVSAMSDDAGQARIVSSLWATPPRGAPETRRCKSADHHEEVSDGLQIYHNPYAFRPLPAEIFRAPRVVQHYKSIDTGEWNYEGHTDALLFRRVETYLRPKDAPSNNAKVSDT